MAIHITHRYRATEALTITSLQTTVMRTNALQPRQTWMAGAASAICLMMSPTWAQDTDTPPVEEVLVVQRSIENTLPLELARYGAELEIVTSEMVRDHGFVDVAQSLELLVPGLHLTSQAGAFSYVNVSMQGSRPSDILWAVDGVRINNRLFNATSPADTLPSSMIERTEVLKGSHSLMYGTQAIAGVVNVVTRGFSNTPDGSVTVGTGSNGLRRINGYGRGAVGDHKFVVWASQDESDGYRIYSEYQPTSRHRKRGYDVTSAGLKYGYEFTPDLSLTLTGIRTDAKVDYPNVSNVSVNDRTEDILSAKLDWLPSDTAQFFLKGYYHSWDTDYYTPGNPSAYWGYDDKGINAAALFKPHDALEYHIGYDYQTYTGEDESLLIARDTEDVHAVFFQLRSTDDLSERARFAAGVRHDETGGNRSNTWNVSGVYDLSQNVYIQGMVGTSFMLPSAENLRRIHCPSGENCTHGNPNLEPEESFAVNLSVGGQLPTSRRALHWQLTAWDRKVDNLITTAPIPDDMPDRPGPEFSRTFINIGSEVTGRGAEALLRGDINDHLSFSLSYTYSKESPADSNEQIPDRPRRQYKGSLGYTAPSARFGANMAFKYVGDKRSDVTGYGWQTYGDTYVFDAGAHMYFDQAQRHRLTARLENVFDARHVTSLGSAIVAGSESQQRFLWERLAPPRSFHLNYTYSFR